MKGSKLIYLMGASGSGKDSLLGYARQRLAGSPGIVFAHRYITRPAEAGGENHVALAPEEFNARLAAGLFAMHWEGHGYRYGIGIEIDQWMAKGLTVVVNGSRGYLPEALRRYPGLQSVTIEVSEATLRKRLLARGREAPEKIEERLMRHQEFTDRPIRGEVIRNDGPIEEAGEALVAFICSFAWIEL